MQILYTKSLMITSIIILLLMEDPVLKPQVEIVIDASINVTSQESHAHPIPISNPSQSYILTRLHAGYFRISISLGAQALLWKILSKPTNESQAFRQVFHMISSTAFHLLWCLALLVLITLSMLFILRCYFHFHLVKAEFLHHIGVNFLYAPWISWLLMLQSAPLIRPKSNTYLVLWLVFAIPILVLDIKIYGQWFTTEKRFLSMMANPTSQISVLGNLVGAQGAAQRGWKESAIFMFSLGMAHYLVLFVTLYQRLPGGNHFPVMLRPAFFLFIVAPSMASLAWSSISGAFDTSSKMLFFLSLFLFMSLACRPTLFKKSMKRFHVAWWAFSFPLTFLALASVEYAKEVKGHIAPAMTLVLLILCVPVFMGLMLLTALNSNRLLREYDPILSSLNELRKTATKPEIAVDK